MSRRTLFSLRSLRPVGPIAVLTLAICMISVAQASAHVYWANIEPETITRANDDGTELEPSFMKLADRPEALAVGEEHIFWTSRTDSAIGSAKLDGSEINEELIKGTELPAAVTVAGGHVYWTEFNKERIGRANLDGSEAERLFIQASSRTFGVGISGEHIYWANFGFSAIGRAKLDGTGVEQEVIPLTIGGTTALTVSGEYIYWAAAEGGRESIGRAKLNGTEVEEKFIPLNGEILGITVQGGHIYWSNIATEEIGQANLDGTEVEESWRPAELPFGIASDVEPKVEPEPEPEHKAEVKVEPKIEPVLAPVVSPPAVEPAPAVCTSSRSVKIHWKAPRRVRLTSAVVTVNGTTYAHLSGKARSALVSFIGSHEETATVKVTATGRDGNEYSTTRVFHPCTGKHSGGQRASLYLNRGSKKRR